MPGRKMLHVLSFVKYNSIMYNTKLIMVIIDDGTNMACSIDQNKCKAYARTCNLFS